MAELNGTKEIQNGMLELMDQLVDSRMAMFLNEKQNFLLDVKVFVPELSRSGWDMREIDDAGYFQFWQNIGRCGVKRALVETLANGVGIHYELTPEISRDLDQLAQLIRQMPTQEERQFLVQSIIEDREFDAANIEKMRRENQFDNSWEGDRLLMTYLSIRENVLVKMPPKLFQNFIDYASGKTDRLEPASVNNGVLIHLDIVPEIHHELDELVLMLRDLPSEEQRRNIVELIAADRNHGPKYIEKVLYDSIDGVRDYSDLKPIEDLSDKANILFMLPQILFEKFSDAVLGICAQIKPVVLVSENFIREPQEKDRESCVQTTRLVRGKLPVRLTGFTQTNQKN